MTRRRIDPVLSAILAVAAAVRLHGLLAQGVDLDEATTAQVFIAKPLWALLFRNVDHGNPPLFYILLRFWAKLFGTSELALRLPSVLLSTATVAAIYGLGRALYDRRAARLAALLSALSACQLAYGQDARMYPLVCLLGVTSTHALWALVARGGRARAFVYVLLAGAGAYTHHQGLVVIAAHAAAVLLCCTVGGATRPRLGRDLLGTGLLLLLGTLPILPLYLGPGLLSATPDAFWQPHVSLAELGAMAGTWIAGAALAGGGAGWPALVLLVPALLVRGPRAPRLLHLVTLYGVIAAFTALAWRVPVWHSRYLAAVQPLFLLGLAVALGRRAAGAAVLVAVVAAGLVAAKLSPGTHQDWRGAAAFIAARDPEAPVLVLGPPYLKWPMSYYRRAPFEVVGDPAALVERATAGAFVVYSDEHHPPDPDRRTAYTLAQRLGLRESVDLFDLHVYELGATYPSARTPPAPRSPPP